MSNILEETKRKFAGVNTMDTLVEVVKEELAGRISFADIVDDLTSDDNQKPLSAAQGKILKEMIANIQLGDSAEVTEEKIKEMIQENTKDFLEISQVLTLAADGGLLDELDITTEETEDEESIKLVSSGLVKVIALSLTDSIDNLNEKVTALEEKVNTIESELQSFEEISESEFMDIWNRDVVRVGSEESLADAIADVAAKGKIVLSADQAISGSNLEINKDLALDLGGKTLTAEGGNWLNVSNGATVTINNGKIVSEKQRAVHVTGGAEVVIGEGAEIEGNGQYTVVAYGGGKLNIGEGSKITNTNGSYPVFVDGSTAVISGAEIDADDNVAIVASNKSNVTIKGATVKSGANGVTAQKTSTVVIEDSVVDAKDYAINAVSGSTITVNSGNFTGGRASVNKSADSTVVINGGTFSDESGAEYVQGGTLENDGDGYTFTPSEE